MPNQTRMDLTTPQIRVVAVDPGYDRAGVAVLDRIDHKEVLVHSSCITTDKSTSLPNRIFSIGEEFEKILQTYSPNHLALETLFFNKNISTGIGVAEARGVILYLAQKHGCLVHEFSPQQIKVATTGYGNSDKTSVIMMVKKLIKNVPEKALDDEYDAIATGITCLAHYPQNQ